MKRLSWAEHEANLLRELGVCGMPTGLDLVPYCTMHKGHGMRCLERMESHRLSLAAEREREWEATWTKTE